MIQIFIFCFVIFVLMLAVPPLYFQPKPDKWKMFWGMVVYSLIAASIITGVAALLQ